MDRTVLRRTVETRPRRALPARNRLAPRLFLLVPASSDGLAAVVVFLGFLPGLPDGLSQIYGLRVKFKHHVKTPRNILRFRRNKSVEKFKILRQFEFGYFLRGYNLSRA